MRQGTYLTNKFAYICAFFPQEVDMLFPFFERVNDSQCLLAERSYQKLNKLLA